MLSYKRSYTQKEFDNAIKNGTCDFSDANLSMINFRGGDFTGYNFTKSCLFQANLNSANCTHANFQEADLRETNFSNAILIDTNFTKADLEGANFTGAIFSKNWILTHKDKTHEILVQEKTIEIKRIIEERAKQLGLTSEELIQEYLKIAAKTLKETNLV